MKTCKECGWQTDPETPSNMEIAEVNQHRRETHPDIYFTSMSKGQNKRQTHKGKRTVKPPEEDMDTDMDAQQIGTMQRTNSTKVRLSAEVIELPADIFLFYYWVNERFPEYEATKSEWLQDVVATWAVEHGEEIGLPLMPYSVVDRRLGAEDDSEEAALVSRD
jgi:hypothetical protein